MTDNGIYDNTSVGVQIDGASNNTIGGMTANAANNILSNETGVYILDQAHDNLIASNNIGTDTNGNFVAGFANGEYGVALISANGNTIQQNFIRGSPTGLAIANNDSHDNDVTGNTITNSSSAGVEIETGAFQNTIGGTAADINLISSNQVGVSIDTQSHDNEVSFNHIGTNPDGNFAAGFANTTSGIVLDSAVHNTVNANVIAGGVNGLLINGTTAQNNIVTGNSISNANYGVFITGASANTIGGPIAAVNGNSITKNVFGVNVDLSQGIQILGNSIGNNVNGNSQTGILLYYSGGATVRANLISGNGGDGIDLLGDLTQNDVIALNTITNNLGSGVYINASNNTIGGTDPGDGNAISQNAGAGVDVQSGTGNKILSNNISGNGGLGIDLGAAGRNTQ